MLKLIAAILLISGVAAGDELLPASLGRESSDRCKPIDLRSELGPILLQGEANLCFAYSAAAMLRQRTGVSVSAMDLATGFYFADAKRLRRLPSLAIRRYLAAHPHFERSIQEYRGSVGIAKDEEHGSRRVPMFHRLDGGHEVPTILLANLRGLCDEGSFRSDGGYEPHRNLISGLERTAWARGLRAGREVRGVDRRFRDPIADIFNTAWLRYNAESCRRVPSPVPLLPIGYAIAESSHDLRTKRKAGAIGLRRWRRYMTALNYALDHHRIAAVGYDLNLYLDPDDSRVLERAPEEIQADSDHSSTVVARRSEGGRCFYLIRDTSGYDCAQYRRPIRERCENHHFWLAEKDLGENFYDLVYLR